MNNKIKIEIDNLLSNVSVARVALTSFISSENVSLDEIMEIISNSYENQHVDNLVDSIQQDMLKQDSQYEEPVGVQNIEEE